MSKTERRWIWIMAALALAVCLVNGIPRFLAYNAGEDFKAAQKISDHALEQMVMAQDRRAAEGIAVVNDGDQIVAKFR